MVDGLLFIIIYFFPCIYKFTDYLVYESARILSLTTTINLSNGKTCVLFIIRECC